MAWAEDDKTTRWTCPVRPPTWPSRPSHPIINRPTTALPAAAHSRSGCHARFKQVRQWPSRQPMNTFKRASTMASPRPLLGHTCLPSPEARPRSASDKPRRRLTAGILHDIGPSRPPVMRRFAQRGHGAPRRCSLHIADIAPRTRTTSRKGAGELWKFPPHYRRGPLPPRYHSRRDGLPGLSPSQTAGASTRLYCGKTWSSATWRPSRPTSPTSRRPAAGSSACSTGPSPSSKAHRARPRPGTRRRAEACPGR